MAINDGMGAKMRVYIFVAGLKLKFSNRYASVMLDRLSQASGPIPSIYSSKLRKEEGRADRTDRRACYIFLNY